MALKLKKANNNNGSNNNGSVTSVGLRFYFMYLFFLSSFLLLFFFCFWHVKGLALRLLSFEPQPAADPARSRRQVAMDDLFVLIPILNVSYIVVVVVLLFAVSARRAASNC